MILYLHEYIYLLIHYIRILLFIWLNKNMFFPILNITKNDS